MKSQEIISEDARLQIIDKLCDNNNIPNWTHQVISDLFIALEWTENKIIKMKRERKKRKKRESINRKLISDLFITLELAEAEIEEQGVDE